jgi:hypothetical protein
VLASCGGLRALPKGIGALTGPRKLSLHRNGGLTTLPVRLNRLPNLELLLVFNCPGLAV